MKHETDKERINTLLFNTLKRLILMSVLACGGVSCDFFQPAEVIPSYIRIDSMPFVGRKSTGYNSQNITDVWVYANNQIVGIYTLPTPPIPILAEGTVNIAVSPGVFSDAVKGNRVYYPFFKQFTQTTTLTKGKVVAIHPVTAYPDNLNIPFTWYQDFEKSDTGYINGVAGTGPISRSAHVAGTDTSLYGKYFATVSAATSTDVLIFTQAHLYKLRQNGMPVYLEMDYKSTCPIAVGLEGFLGTASTPNYDLILKPTGNWTKVYVSLSDEAQKFASGATFRFFINSISAPGLGSSFSVDNLKLIQF